jgi:hypothetical protein
MVKIEGLTSVETGLFEGEVFFVVSYEAAGWGRLFIQRKTGGGNRLLVRHAVLREVGRLVVLLHLWGSRLWCWVLWIVLLHLRRCRLWWRRRVGYALWWGGLLRRWGVVLSVRGLIWGRGRWRGSIVLLSCSRIEPR